MGVTTAAMTLPVRRRQVWLRVVAGFLAVWWGLFFFGIVDLLAFSQGDEFHATLLLSTGWGLLFLFFVAGPLGVVSVGSRRAAAAAPATVMATAVAVLTAAALSTSPRYLLAFVGLAVTVALMSALGGGPTRGWWGTWRPSGWPLLLVAAAAVPAVHYAWTAARNAGTATLTDDTLGLDHWPAQAALPVAGLLIGLLAAGHPDGWRLPTYLLGSAGAWFAVVSWVEPDLVGSMSRPWSGALLVWSLGFVMVTEVSAAMPARSAGPAPAT